MPTLNLAVKGVNIPSFKNHKMLCRGRMITDPKKQKVMEQIIQSFVSELRFGSVITAAGTLTEQQVRCLIVSLLPEDDSWQWIPEIHVSVSKCGKGEEGATIEITQI